MAKGYSIDYPLKMRNRLKVLPPIALILLLGRTAMAFSPVATVSSPEPFTLDGRSVTVAGVTSVPLGVGSEVATSTAPALLFFADGSSVKLAAGSRAKLTGSETAPKVILLAGSLDYKVVLGSNLSVTSLDLERKSKPVAGRAMQPKPLTTPRSGEVTLP